MRNLAWLSQAAQPQSRQTELPSSKRSTRLVAKHFVQLLSAILRFGFLHSHQPHSPQTRCDVCASQRVQASVTVSQSGQSSSGAAAARAVRSRGGFQPPHGGVVASVSTANT